MTDDIDFDSSETPYINVEVPSEDDIYDEFLNQCESEDIGVDLFEEISDILCNMLLDVYPSGELSDSEEEYLMQSIDETIGEIPDEMMDIAKAHNLETLKAFADKKLKE